MTDKEYRDYKKKVHKYVTKWRDILGLGRDRLSFNWVRGIDENSPRTLMSINAMWEYRNHSLNVYLEECKQVSDEELEDSVIHELSHILINPVSGSPDGKSQAEIEKMEYATQSVAYAIIWAYQAGKESKK